MTAGWFLANARDLPFHLFGETTGTVRVSRVEGFGAMRLHRLRLFAVDGVTPVTGLGEVM